MAITDSVLKDIPRSQTSIVRHKDAYQAYELGYLAGMQKTAVTSFNQNSDTMVINVLNI